MTPMPARAVPFERIQAASAAFASIGNWLRCGGGFPVKTKRRRPRDRRIWPEEIGPHPLQFFGPITRERLDESVVETPLKLHG
jgi:hypothetical protein